MPWNDQSGGGQSGGQGPWGGGTGPRRPWGSPPRQSPRGSGPDLEDLLRQWRERFRMGGAGGGRGRQVSWPLLLAILIFGWGATGFYTVDEGERGVVTQFGEYNRTTPPGLHWKWPQPIEGLQIYNVTGQRKINIGFREQGDNIVDTADESLMITGDRNLVEVRFSVNYNIRDVFAYSFNIQNPYSSELGDEVVRQVAESAMREVIGRRQLEPIITTDRALVEQDVQELTQRVLDEYESGVQILQVQLLRAAAPQAVIEAFNDVVNAGQDAETARNNANREAATIVNEAQAYRERVIREARGDAQRFLSVYEEYRQAPQVTRDRIYIETMEHVYSAGNLVILDANGAVTYLPLESLLRRDPPAPSSSGSAN